MTPFKASLPGRLIAFSIAFALISGGLIPVAGLNHAIWVPASLLVPIVGCVLGIILAIQDHLRWAATLVVALPLLLWPYIMVLLLVTSSHPELAWLLLAGGAVVTALALAGFFPRSLIALGDSATVPD